VQYQKSKRKRKKGRKIVIRKGEKIVIKKKEEKGE